jgi:hypothetical protein
VLDIGLGHQRLVHDPRALGSSARSTSTAHPPRRPHERSAGCRLLRRVRRGTASSRKGGTGAGGLGPDVANQKRVIGRLATSRRGEAAGFPLRCSSPLTLTREQVPTNSSVADSIGAVIHRLSLGDVAVVGDLRRWSGGGIGRCPCRPRRAGSSGPDRRRPHRRDGRAGGGSAARVRCCCRPPCARPRRSAGRPAVDDEVAWI